MKKNIRIKDIAEMAQVSMGTVDRVLHRRGRVSAAAEERVQRVLREIDYRPNLVAKTLSQAQTYRIAVLMPHSDTDPFWHKPRRGVSEAEQQLSTFGVEVLNFPFDAYDSVSFRAQAKRALEVSPSGILLAPILRQEALKFGEVCRQQRIPLVCFNTYIEELPTAIFVGQDLHQSGRVAAQLMATRLPAGTVLIIHIAESAQNSAHLYAKEQGFRQFLSERGVKLDQLVTIEVDNPDTAGFAERFYEQLAPYHDVKGIFITTAKAYALAPCLEERGLARSRVIGYDLTEPNLPYLRNGVIDILIHQEAQKQAFLGVSYLVDQLVFKKEVPKINHLPLGIVISENLESYLLSD